MGKVLLYVSIAVTLLAAVLGFLNKGKLSSTKEDLQQKVAALDDSEKKLKSTETAAAAAKAEAETATAEKATALSQVDTLKSDLEKNKSQVSDLTAQITAKTTEVNELDAKLKEAETKLANTSTGEVAPAAGPSAEDQVKMQEQETLITKLQGDLTAAQGQLETLKTEKNNRMALKMRNGLEGSVLAVNQAWNFIVMNIGDRNGVVGNAEMLIKRGGKLVGKVRVTSVEPSTAIADIVLNSVPRGVTIQPGDNVIYQATAE